MDGCGKGVLWGCASTIKNCKPYGDNTNYLNRQGSVGPCALGCPFLRWTLTSVQMPRISGQRGRTTVGKISLQVLWRPDCVQHLEVILGHVQVAECEVLESGSVKR